MKCIECKYFRVLHDPFGYEWGEAKCERYNLYTEYRDKRKLNKLTHEQGREVAELELKGGEHG